MCNFTKKEELSAASSPVKSIDKNKFESQYLHKNSSVKTPPSDFFQFLKAKANFLLNF